MAQHCTLRMALGSIKITTDCKEMTKDDTRLKVCEGTRSPVTSSFSSLSWSNSPLFKHHSLFLMIPLLHLVARFRSCWTIYCTTHCTLPPLFNLSSIPSRSIMSFSAVHFSSDSFVRRSMPRLLISDGSRDAVTSVTHCWCTYNESATKPQHSKARSITHEAPRLDGQVPHWSDNLQPEQVRLDWSDLKQTLWSHSLLAR